MCCSWRRFAQTAPRVLQTSIIIVASITDLGEHYCLDALTAPINRTGAGEVDKVEKVETYVLPVLPLA